MLFTSIFKAFFGIYMMKFFKNRPAGEIINPPILNDGLVPFGDYFSLIWNDCYLEDAVRFQRGCSTN
jgi:hypothetical protein